MYTNLFYGTACTYTYLFTSTRVITSFFPILLFTHILAMLINSVSILDLSGNFLQANLSLPLKIKVRPFERNQLLDLISTARELQFLQSSGKYQPRKRHLMSSNVLRT